MYRVKLSKHALKDADRLPEEIWQRILDALRTLEQSPRPHGCVKIRGDVSLYRIRVGDYRALYDIDDANRLVVVMRIQHRREAYRKL
jgi:mRNA interferase RelE/StbE